MGSWRAESCRAVQSPPGYVRAPTIRQTFPEMSEGVKDQGADPWEPRITGAHTAAISAVAVQGVTKGLGVNRVTAHCIQSSRGCRVGGVRKTIRHAIAIAKSRPDPRPMVECRHGRNGNERSLATGTEGRAFHRAHCPAERGDGVSVARAAGRKRSPSQSHYWSIAQPATSGWAAGRSLPKCGTALTGQQQWRTLRTPTSLTSRRSAFDRLTRLDSWPETIKEPAACGPDSLGGPRNGQTETLARCVA